MIWFNKWLYARMQQAQTYQNKIGYGGLAGSGQARVNHNVSSDMWDNSLTFSVYAAVGGTIVECKSFDGKTDRLNKRLYIINDTDNFSVAMAHIISVERLKA